MRYLGVSACAALLALSAGRAIGQPTPTGAGTSEKQRPAGIARPTLPPRPTYDDVVRRMRPSGYRGDSAYLVARWRLHSGGIPEALTASANAALASGKLIDLCAIGPDSRSGLIVSSWPNGTWAQIGMTDLEASLSGLISRRANVARLVPRDVAVAPWTGAWVVLYTDSIFWGGFSDRSDSLLSSQLSHLQGTEAVRRLRSVFILPHAGVFFQTTGTNMKGPVVPVVDLSKEPLQWLQANGYPSMISKGLTDIASKVAPGSLRAAFANEALYLFYGDGGSWGAGTEAFHKLVEGIESRGQIECATFGLNGEYLIVERRR